MCSGVVPQQPPMTRTPLLSMRRAKTGPPTSRIFLAKNQLGAKPIWANDIPNRASAEATRQKILTAARTAFAAKGFDGANLSGTDFQNATLARCRFDEARVEQAIFKGARLESCNFSKARMRGVDLSGATLEKVNLTGADLERAKRDLRDEPIGKRERTRRACVRKQQPEFRRSELRGDVGSADRSAHPIRHLVEDLGEVLLVH